MCFAVTAEDGFNEESWPSASRNAGRRLGSKVGCRVLKFLDVILNLWAENEQRNNIKKKHPFFPDRLRRGRRGVLTYFI